MKKTISTIVLTAFVTAVMIEHYPHQTDKKLWEGGKNLVGKALGLFTKKSAPVAENE